MKNWWRWVCHRKRWLERSRCSIFHYLFICLFGRTIVRVQRMCVVIEQQQHQTGGKGHVALPFSLDKLFFFSSSCSSSWERRRRKKKRANFLWPLCADMPVMIGDCGIEEKALHCIQFINRDDLISDCFCGESEWVDDFTRTIFTKPNQRGEREREKKKKHAPMFECTECPIWWPWTWWANRAIMYLQFVAVVFVIFTIICSREKNKLKNQGNKKKMGIWPTRQP